MERAPRYHNVATAARSRRSNRGGITTGLGDREGASVEPADTAREASKRPCRKGRGWIEPRAGKQPPRGAAPAPWRSNGGNSTPARRGGSGIVAPQLCPRAPKERSDPAHSRLVADAPKPWRRSAVVPLLRVPVVLNWRLHRRLQFCSTGI